MPSITVGAGTLISPASALTYYQAQGLTSNPRTTTDPEIVNLARALGNDPDKIYWWVRNNVRLTPTFGLSKGARGAAIDRAGTAFDQAHLMVEMLRASGFAAQYKLGTITLTGAQFSSWFGVSDATAATRLLADGGIPATVSATGATINSVVMMHIWVTATLGGTSYAFDPSYKASTVTPGIALSSAIGFNGTTFLSGALTGAQTDTTGGVAKIRHLNIANIASAMQGYSTTLLTYLKTNQPTADMDAVMGATDIVTVAEIPLRQTSLSYQTTVGATFSNDIPNALRTSLRIHMDDIDVTFYGDEIYAKPLIVQYSRANAYYTGWQINLDGVTVAHGAYVTELLTFKCLINVDINHPYAASSGAYMDDTFTQNAYAREVPVVILLGLGETSAEYRQRIALRVGGAKGNILQDQCTSSVTDPDLNTCVVSGTFDYAPGQRALLGAAWLAQFWRLADLSSRMDGTMTLHHHSIVMTSLLPQLQDGAHTALVIGSSDKMNIDTGLSLESLSNDAGMRKTALATLASLANTLEASVAEQSAQSTYPTSVASSLDWVNRATVPTGSDWIEYATPANWTTAKANLLADYVGEWADVTSNKDPPPVAGSQVALVSAQADAFIQAGYSLVLPVSSFLGPGAQRNVLLPGGPTTFQYYDPSVDRGGAFIGYLPDDSHIAYDVVRGDGTDKGGGGSVTTNPDELFKPEANVLDKNGGVHGIARDVDMRSGTLSLTMPPDIVAGSGPAPFSLSYQRTFRAGFDAGWTSNWDSGISVSGDGLAAMGGSSPRAAAELLVTLTALNWLAPTAQGTDLDTLEHHVIAGLVNMWWAERVASNTVEVTMGASQKAFTLLADNSLAAPPGDASTLSGTVVRQFGSDPVGNTTIGPGWYTLPASVAPRIGNGSGTTGFYRGVPNGSRKLPGNACNPYGDLSQYAFTLTEPDRTVATFAFFCTERRANADDLGAIPQYQVARTGWNLTHIAYPAGTSVDLTYTVPPTADGVESSWWPLLTDVANSLGRHLTLAYAAAPGAGVMTVSDATDPAHPRTATFDGVACKASPWLKQSDYTAPCSTLFGAVHDPEGNTTTYDYIRQWDGGQATDMLAASGQFSQFVGDNLPWQMPAHLAAIHLPASTAAADYAFAYDEIGRLRSATDAEGHVWQYRIANGRRGEIVDPLSGHTVSLFDPNAREVADIDALGRLSTMAYDGLGRVTAKTGPEGIREDTLYDARSNPIRTTRHAKPGSGLADLATSATYHATCNVPLTETDARGATVTHAIDNATCLETARTDPAVAGGAPVTSWTYNGLGQVLTETDPTGLRTRYTYNGSHYLASVIASDGALNLTTSFGYDAAGNVTSLTDPRGNSHTATYDRNRRITEWDAPLGAVTQWTYDPTGLLLTLKRATGNGGAPWATTGFTYWPTGKVHTSTDPDGSVTVTEHDALGRASRVTDPMGRAVSTTYDLIGEVLQERHAAGTASEIVYATHTWSPDGKELSVADANGNLTAYAYDGFDRMARQTYPSPTTAGLTNPSDYEAFVYDANGNVTGHRIRGGVTITSTYDALDRLIRRLVPAFGAQGADVTTATAYDRAGRETAVSDTLGNTIVSAYDTAGRLSATTRTTPALAARTVSYQYDAASNRTRLTWPDGYYVQYAFDALDRMSTASENGATTLGTYSYDPMSRRTGLAYGNGTAITYGYTPASDLVSLVHDLAGTANDATTTLTHNLAHQLSGESVTNPAWRLASPATGSTTYVPNGLNQYASVGGSGLTYDADGNLTTDGAWTYGYDGENRLLVAKTAGTLAVYAYDPRGRRTTKGITIPAAPLWGTAVWGAFTWTAAATTTTSFLHDGDNEIAEYDGAGALIRRFVPGPAIDQPIAMVAAAGTRTYVHTNRQGSVVTMSNASGAPAEGPYAYDAYGTCTVSGAPCAMPTSTTIPFRYTGRYLDAETGLYYYRARYYSSVHGRFLQTDPVGYKDDFNLYTYVGNDPADMTDPMGLDPCVVGDDGIEHCDVSRKRDDPPPIIPTSGRPKPTMPPPSPPPSSPSPANPKSPDQPGSDAPATGPADSGDVDGYCKLPDGSVHAYKNIGGSGFVAVYGGGGSNATGQAGLGYGMSNSAMPTMDKPGGIGGGGPSGRVTSPASAAARGLTGGARVGGVKSLTGTASVGGSIGRALPVLGALSMFAEFESYWDAPTCTDIPTRREASR